MNLEFCVTTLTTDDYYQNYLPTFIYSIRKACPDIWVKTFIRGRLNELNREAFNYMQDNKVFFDMPVECMFTDYPDLPSTTNALRFLIDVGRFEYAQYVYFTDADFIYLSHEPPIDQYYVQKLHLWEECYWGRRGPKRDRKSREITKRIAGGGFLATRQWFAETADLKTKMVYSVANGDIGEAREDDEKMLWDICAGSGLKCPTFRGNTRRKKYKEIHLGDFKTDFKRWKSNRKMKQRITMGNLYKWFRLEEDPVWKGLTEIVCKEPKIAEVFENLRDYMNRRNEKRQRDAS